MSIKNGIVQRASRYSAIRRYFDQQSVLEVEVPILGKATATDPLLASMEVLNWEGNPKGNPEGNLNVAEKKLYLQTSPELFMKRLLCQGSGSIYAIAKSFRAGEISKMLRG